jgi:hypothetical protein
MTPSTAHQNQNGNVPAPGPLMLRQYIHWRQLIGTTVQIRHNGRIIRTGTIDDAMADSTALWIAGDPAQPRTMYEAAHGIEVWSEPEETEDGLCYRMTSTAPSPN